MLLKATFAVVFGTVSLPKRDTRHLAQLITFLRTSTGIDVLPAGLEPGVSPPRPLYSRAIVRAVVRIQRQLQLHVHYNRARAYIGMLEPVYLSAVDGACARYLFWVSC